MSIWPWKKPSPEKRTELLVAEISYLTPLIGGWPIRIESGPELHAVGERWHKAVKVAEGLLNELPDSINAKWMLGELLRMGHNMDVAGAAVVAHGLLQEVVEKAPHDYRGHYSLASFYVTSVEGMAETAERLFLKARELAPSALASDISQGLGFACLHQKKNTDAISHFERCVAEGNKEPRIRDLLVALKEGKDVSRFFQQTAD